jgi:hypothetical protein
MNSLILRLFEWLNYLLLILDCILKFINFLGVHLTLFIKVSLPIFFEFSNQRLELLCNLLKKLVLVLLSTFNWIQAILCSLDFFISLNYSDKILICCLLYFIFELLSVFLCHFSYFLTELCHSLVLFHMLSIESQNRIDLVLWCFLNCFNRFFKLFFHLLSPLFITFFFP